ncbi:DUF7221 family queuine tRNA-ribosyltransferase-like protein [Massilia aerilata]|uniref:DeoxyPurine in DNA protein A domain-containing protein n=1 Tax=Massilia aerilata TaxID=453817 RepID=A0ABW0RZV7_9BURK
MYNDALNELPIRQKNAHLSDDFVMRVGLPHSGGRLAAHAFNEDFKVMVSASAFWNRATRQFHMPKATDLSELDFALDSAGYTGILNFQRNGLQDGMACVFPWDYAAYMEFANLSGCSWYSQADLCVENQVARDREAIDYRIRATATLLEGMLQILYAWQNELSRSCNSTVVANLLRPPVPVLQGRNIGDYLFSLELLNSVWDRWNGWLDTPALIGVGSMCRRDLHDPEEGLYAIAEALGRNFPKGSRAHFFGVKNQALNEIPKMGFIASSDSMSYDFNSRVKAHKARAPNSMERRTKEMSEWMSAAMARVSASARLPSTFLCN